MLNRIKAEPALASSAVVALLNLGAAFGLHLSGDQLAAINGVVAVALALFFVRPRVTPTATTNEGGNADAVTLLVVGTFVGVLLLLFGIRLH